MHVATPKTDEKLGEEAAKIAEIIALTQVAQREALFSKIAYDLKFSYAQGFTSSLFEKIASVS